MHNNSSVLVLLATYNGKDWLDAQITSILQQSHSNLRILISDDASTDGTRDLIERLSREHDNVIVLPGTGPKKGAGQNFFHLIKVADLTGVDYVALCDQDDLWLKDKLSRSITAMETTQSDAYSSAAIAFWPDGREKLLDQSDKQSSVDYVFEGCGQGCTFLLSGSLARRLREFLSQNERLTLPIHYHDWAIYAVSRIWGRRWYFDHEPTIRYRQHNSNDTGARSSIAGTARRIKLIRSGWYKQQVRSILDLCQSASTGHSLSSAHVHFESLFIRKKRSLRTRIVLGMTLARVSRRRLADRLALSTSALLGWL